MRNEVQEPLFPNGASQPTGENGLPSPDAYPLPEHHNLQTAAWQLSLVAENEIPQVSHVRNPPHSALVPLDTAFLLALQPLFRLPHTRRGPLHNPDNLALGVKATHVHGHMTGASCINHHQSRNTIECPIA